MLRASIPSTIEFRRDIQADCGLIDGDPTQIHQIIMNLCTNAYHAMRQSGGVLAVSLRPVTLTREETKNQPDLAPGRWLQLEISDTGTGMDADTVTRIFEPYFTTKGKGEGTGLGLAVVHGIVQEHHGYIGVYSKPGIGTTFRIYFHELQQTIATKQGNGQGTLQTGSGHVLLVDDEETILGMLSGLLSAAGYEVTTHNDPQQALAAFNDKPHDYDIVITDMTMPSMTGFDLAKGLLEQRPDLPIILCTGYSELISKEMALQAGIKRFLMKPVSGHKLTSVVHELLDNKNTASG